MAQKLQNCGRESDGGPPGLEWFTPASDLSDRDVSALPGSLLIWRPTFKITRPERAMSAERKIL